MMAFFVGFVFLVSMFWLYILISKTIVGDIVHAISIILIVGIVVFCLCSMIGNVILGFL